MNNFRLLIRTSDILHKVPRNSGLLREDDGDANQRLGAELGAVHLVPTKTDGTLEPNLVDSSAGIYFKVGTALDGTSQNKIVRVGGAYVTSNDIRPDVRELSNEDVDYTGNFWYRADTHDLSINTDGTHTAEAWKSLTPRYDRDLPTPYSVGGVKSGSTFDDLTLQEVLDDIFYPSTEVSLTNLNIEPSPTGAEDNLTIEVGDQVSPPGGINIRTLSITTAAFSSVTSVSYRGGTDLDAMQPAENIFTAGAYSGLDKNRVFNYTQTTPISYAYPNNFYWQALLTDADGNVNAGPHRSVSWAYRALIFSSVNTTEADPVATYTVKATLAAATLSVAYSFGVDLGDGYPAAPLSRPTSVGKLATGSPEYLYVYLPIGRVVNDILVDDGYTAYSHFTSNDGLGVAMEAPTTVDITRNNILVRYLVYRSTVATRAAYTINLF